MSSATYYRLWQHQMELARLEATVGVPLRSTDEESYAHTDMERLC